MLFIRSIHLSGSAIVSFVTALQQVSSIELHQEKPPRIFSLQKLVEVTDYNMNRVYFTWARIWSSLRDHFAFACLHPSVYVRLCALDALRQLAAKFLSQRKRERALFHFREEFLLPFLTVIGNPGSQEAVKEYVLDILKHLIASRGKQIQSGWRVVLLCLHAAATDIVSKAAGSRDASTLGGSLPEEEEETAGAAAVREQLKQRLSLVFSILVDSLSGYLPALVGEDISHAVSTLSLIAANPFDAHLATDAIHKLEDTALALIEAGGNEEASAAFLLHKQRASASEKSSLAAFPHPTTPANAAARPFNFSAFVAILLALGQLACRCGGGAAGGFGVAGETAALSRPPVAVAAAAAAAAARSSRETPQSRAVMRKASLLAATPRSSQDTAPLQTQQQHAETARMPPRVPEAAGKKTLLPETRFSSEASSKMPAPESLAGRRETALAALFRLLQHHGALLAVPFVALVVGVFFHASSSPVPRKEILPTSVAHTQELSLTASLTALFPRLSFSPDAFNQTAPRALLARAAVPPEALRLSFGLYFERFPWSNSQQQHDLQQQPTRADRDADAHVSNAVLEGLLYEEASACTDVASAGDPLPLEDRQLLLRCLPESVCSSSASSKAMHASGSPFDNLAKLPFDPQDVATRCVAQLLLIDVLQKEVVNLLPMPLEALRLLLCCFEGSFLFAFLYNEQVSLRAKLQRCGFMSELKQLPGLLKQQREAAAAAAALLLAALRAEHSPDSLLRADGECLPPLSAGDSASAEAATASGGARLSAFAISRYMRFCRWHIAQYLRKEQELRELAEAPRDHELQHRDDPAAKGRAAQDALRAVQQADLAEGARALASLATLVSSAVLQGVSQLPDSLVEENASLVLGMVLELVAAESRELREESRKTLEALLARLLPDRFTALRLLPPRRAAQKELATDLPKPTGW
ncbi:sec7 domain-containing protein [Cyclospora cayetanensis]|uniref:Sec7 domain-containing protein n=1 Tax=Cyclospora cayetanensis TaxID=88456 RepID=A0A1D3CV93_9EIME|nr:sec7 domain-containing protein [Cyclospora cayetanensis]